MTLPSGDKPGSLGTAFAAAKINLALHVVGQRSDGYHELDSLVVFAAVGDRLEVFAAAGAEGDSLEITGPFAGGLSAGPDNLVLRTAAALRLAAPSLPALAFRLAKQLPVASGIGGGSADAAATLRLLAGLPRLPIDAVSLATIAASLGADVPMCLQSRPVRAQGIGEVLTAWEGVPRLPMVLVNPGVAVSTPAVFRRLDRRDNQGIAEAVPAFNDIEALAGWLAIETRNDLETAAIAEAPQIAHALSALAGCDACVLARMSGSGATTFALFGDDEAAQRAALRIGRDHPAWWVVATSAEGA